MKKLNTVPLMSSDIEPVTAAVVQFVASPRRRAMPLPRRCVVLGSAWAAASLFLFEAVALQAQSAPPANVPLSGATVAQSTDGATGSIPIAGTVTASPSGAGSMAMSGSVVSGHGYRVGAPPHNRTLLILTSETSASKQADLQEDLAIMSKVLDNALSDFGLGSERARTAMGIMLTPGSAPIRNLYIEGYGALFTINLNFPLVPPPPQPRGEKGAPAPSSAWEQAKRQVNGAAGFDWYVGNSLMNGGAQGPQSPGPWETYSKEKVDRLETATLKALKNATNIRGLRPDDSITVCIFGSSPSPEAGQRLPPVAGDLPLLQRLGVPVVGGSRMGSILTVRVKKAYVDAFAKGKMTEEAFRQDAQITAYATALGAPGGGTAISRYGNPFSGGGFSGGIGGFGGGIGGGGSAGGGIGGSGGAEQQ
jgi:hypothetical protein